MRNTLFPLFVTIGLSIFSVFADYLLKRASAFPQPFSRWYFTGAVFIYVVSCFAWIYVLRHMKLATIGAIYSVSAIGLLTVIGLTVFRESLSISELVGLASAVLALVLLGRIAYT